MSLQHTLLRSWPLAAPGMPEAGPDFLAAAQRLGDDVSQVSVKKGKKAEPAVIGLGLQQLYNQALRTPGFRLPVAVRGGQAIVEFIPGHVWAQHAEAFARSMSDVSVVVPPVDGPHACEAMIIGKMPWIEEAQVLRDFVGATGEELVASLGRMKVEGAGRWYITNLIKFMPPHGIRTLASAWLRDCLPILHAELRLVRPKFILCLGADAAKAILGKSVTIGYLDGRVVPWEFPCHLYGQEPQVHKCQVMAVVHPAQVARDDSLQRTLDRGIARFGRLVSGAFDVEEVVDHRVIDTWEAALAWANAAGREVAKLAPADRLVAWDAEWHGSSPRDPAGWLRTVQCSWADKKAVVFRLRLAGGAPSFVDQDGHPAEQRLFRLLQAFCERLHCRAVGHFFNSDLEWFERFGFDPTDACPVPEYGDDDKAAWDLMRNGQGWLDTAMMVHAVEETALLGLEVLSNRYTNAPRYDVPLADWRAAWAKETGLAKGKISGFGDVPEDILVGEEIGAADYGTRVRNSYSAYDADVTRRIAVELLPLISKDYYGHDCWEPFWESMAVQPIIREMRQNGLLVDRERIDAMTRVFLSGRNRHEQDLKDWAGWPDFNPRSVFDARELLFGETYNGKDWIDGQPVRLRPDDGRIVGVRPILDTSKPPKRWDDIAEAGLERLHSPSTGKASLNVLISENPDQAEPLQLLQGYRFLDQILKSVLRPPVGEEAAYLDDEDNWVYDGGLVAAIDPDGRVRTRLSATADTGRFKSSKPPLQNVSKSRDKDYFRLLGDAYSFKLRSIFMAPPGHSLIESDYVGAELAMLAYSSGDVAMIDHIRRSALLEDHPDYYDIHARLAVEVFRLDCQPTKAAMDAADYGHFRTLAKNVVFGLMYGRSAKAIALQARETRKPGEPEFTIEMAELVVHTFFRRYAKAAAFLTAAGHRATSERWACHAFGRYRRVPAVRDQATAGEFERVLKNFYEQGGVASAVDRAMIALRYYRDTVLQQPGLFKLSLPVHDAIILEVPDANVERVVDEVIPEALVRCVPVYSIDPSGRRTGGGPYYLAAETVVMPRWGEKYSEADCVARGIPSRFAKKQVASKF